MSDSGFSARRDHRDVLQAAFRDRAVYLRDADALVLADLHVGRAEASDVDAPLGEADELADRLGALLDRFSPSTAVFAGDLLHEFDRASARAERALGSLAEACRDAGATPVAVRGNHDTVLDSAWDGPVHDAHALAGRDRRIVVRHGHESPPPGERADLYVVGHDHPTIPIEGQRRPCALYQPGVDGDGTPVLVLPAFSRVAAGVDVSGMRTDEFLSPLVRDADALRPIVFDGDDSLSFPPLGEFRAML